MPRKKESYQVAEVDLSMNLPADLAGQEVNTHLRNETQEDFFMLVSLW